MRWYQRHRGAGRAALRRFPRLDRSVNNIIKIYSTVHLIIYSTMPAYSSDPFWMCALRTNGPVLDEIAHLR